MAAGDAAEHQAARQAVLCKAALGLARAVEIGNDLAVHVDHLGRGAGAQAGQRPDPGPGAAPVQTRGLAGRGPGGAERNRTADLLIANETLYQLSYDPNKFYFKLLRRILK